mmetsp:Transcript_51081/g.143804  ORF Transcript_51081/g.143804 Transcript_51081/m.143804 type:complete len:305 (-) Transcript_51081:243-1157(-)
MGHEGLELFHERRALKPLVAALGDNVLHLLDELLRRVVLLRVFGHRAGVAAAGLLLLARVLVVLGLLLLLAVLLVLVLRLLALQLLRGDEPLEHLLLADGLFVGLVAVGLRRVGPPGVRVTALGVAVAGGVTVRAGVGTAAGAAGTAGVAVRIAARPTTRPAGQGALGGIVGRLVVLALRGLEVGGVFLELREVVAELDVALADLCAQGVEGFLLVLGEFLGAVLLLLFQVLRVQLVHVFFDAVDGLDELGRGAAVLLDHAPQLLEHFHYRFVVRDQRREIVVLLVVRHALDPLEHLLVPLVGV